MTRIGGQFACLRVRLVVLGVAYTPGMRDLRVLLGGCVVVGSMAFGQAPDGPAPEAVPPQVLLGRRVNALRVNLKVRPTVVIVPSRDDFVRAVGRWTLAERYPILIDNGTDRAREDIARFVRAFEPKALVRWKDPGAAKIPGDPDQARGAIDGAFHASWGAKDAAGLAGIWKEAGFVPFGAVVASPHDPAWTGALALAAGRGQPILWLDTKSASVSHFISEEQARAIDRTLCERLDGLERPWRASGDEIEALTICANIGANIESKSGRLALTDFVCRGEGGVRAVYAAILPGDEAQAAYRAMCALFLQPRKAWLFDGYKQDFAPPYALPPAAKLLNDAGFDVSSNMPPLGGLSHWRQRAALGVGADFIHVNSSGNSDFFELSPGRGYAGDVPFLNHPAMVNMIHSFSVQFAGSPKSIGGRWLENGAYCYYGSMDEPYLGAFLPAQSVATRLLLGAPFAAAVRLDDAKVWKLNVFGDPLMTIGKPAPRHDEPASLEGGVSVETEMKEALKAGRLDAGIGALVLLGRDTTAVQLARAALKDDGKAVTPAVARIALAAAFREKDKALFYDLYERLPPEGRGDWRAADMLWQLARDEINSTEDTRVLNWLRAAVRDECPCEDAEALAPALRRAFGVEAVRSMYGSLLGKVKSDNVRQRLQKEAARY